MLPLIPIHLRVLAIMFRITFLSMMLFILVQVVLTQGAAVAETASADSRTSEEMLLLGERMYREGILPNGEPMQAMVAADVPVDG